MIRAVIDTNILIRAVIKPKGTVGPILRQLRDGEYTLLYSEPLLAELLDVLNRPRIKGKYRLSPEDIGTVIALLMVRGEEVRPTERIEDCRDPKDNMVLEVAVAGRADAIVSGDDDLSTLSPYRGIPVLSSARFLRLLDEEK